MDFTGALCILQNAHATRIHEHLGLNKAMDRPTRISHTCGVHLSEQTARADCNRARASKTAAPQPTTAVQAARLGPHCRAEPHVSQTLDPNKPEQSIAVCTGERGDQPKSMDLYT